MSAKTISKVLKVVASVGIVICAVLKWLDVLPMASAGEICMVWACVYGVGAGTIDLNIMFDKFVSSSGRDKCGQVSDSFGQNGV